MVNCKKKTYLKTGGKSPVKGMKKGGAVKGYMYGGSVNKMKK